MTRFYKPPAQNATSGKKAFFASPEAVQTKISVYDCGDDNILTFIIRIFHVLGSERISLELETEFAKEFDPSFLEGFAKKLSESELSPYLGNYLISSNSVYSYRFTVSDLEKIHTHPFSAQFLSQLKHISKNPFICLYETLIKFKPPYLKEEANAPRKIR